MTRPSSAPASIPCTARGFRERLGRTLRTAALAVCLLSLPLAGPAGAAFAAGDATGDSPSRGRALYEEACTSCHGKSVHDRSPRSAATPEALRDFVRRWSTATGARWSEADIDDVVIWLNQRYYHFPCAAAGCLGRRAEGAPVSGHRPAS